jgi:MFS family permease
MMTYRDTKLAKMNGLLQTFTGLGMLVGPILGSLLYKLGGY